MKPACSTARACPKTDPRVAAYGDVDELQAALGVAAAAGLDAELADMVVALQRDLFALGARLADPSHTHRAARHARSSIDDDSVARLEGWIDRPRGGAAAAAPLHPLRRSPGWRGAAPGADRLPPRRACDAGAGRATPSSRSCCVYLNRVSDLLFVMARAANHRAGVAETEW